MDESSLGERDGSIGCVYMPTDIAVVSVFMSSLSWF